MREVRIQRPGHRGHPGTSRKVYVRLNFQGQRKTRTFDSPKVAQEYADLVSAVFYAMMKTPEEPETLIHQMATSIPEHALHLLTGDGAFLALVDQYAVERARSRFLAEATRRRDKRRLVAKSHREALFDALGRVCASCRSTARLTFDHILPWSHGGKTERSNLRVLCG